LRVQMHPHADVDLFEPGEQFVHQPTF
jgi:hypothetical protein